MQQNKVQPKRLKKKEALYGIFQQRNHRFTDPGRSPWRRSRYLVEGYGNDNPGAKSQGMKQLMAGGGVALIGTTLVPLLSGLFG